MNKLQRKGKKTPAGIKLAAAAGAALAALFLGRMFYLASQSQGMSVKLGVEEGKLTYCPQKPNCVSSQEEGDHYTPPIKSSLGLREAKQRVLGLPNARLEEEGENYLHVTFKSDLFGFLDDVELYKTNGLYHVRSASRVGYSDMEANRERVERLRLLLKEKPGVKN